MCMIKIFSVWDFSQRENLFSCPITRQRLIKHPLRTVIHMFRTWYLLCRISQISDKTGTPVIRLSNKSSKEKKKLKLLRKIQWNTGQVPLGPWLIVLCKILLGEVRTTQNCQYGQRKESRQRGICIGSASCSALTATNLLGDTIKHCLSNNVAQFYSCMQKIYSCFYACYCF